MFNFANLLSEQESKNAAIVINEAVKGGITNPYSIAAILSIVSKESNFKPVRENMNYTSASSINRIFGVPLSEAQTLVRNPEKLANRVYGGKNGNGSNEGYKYRGGGYNQLTFKNAYKKYGDKIGVNLVGNPELITDPVVAAKVLVEYFKESFSTLKRLGKLQEYGGANDINDFKDTTNAALAFFHANAGVGRSVSHVKDLSKDSTGGKKKTLDRIEGFFEAIKTEAYDIVSGKKK